MANTRLARVEEMLRREIAQLIVEGNLRDPRLQRLGHLSVTAVRVTADLRQARVFVDTLGEKRRRSILEGLNAAAGPIQRELGRRIHLKRTPRLTFEWDASIEAGNRIEQVLAEIRDEEAGSNDESS